MTAAIVGYQRVSTKGQGESGLGIEAQEAAIQAYARQTGAKIKGADKQGDFVVTPGEQRFKVKRGDLEFETDKFVLKKGSTGKYHFSLVAADGQVVATSPSYEYKQSALDAIEASDGRVGF